MEKTFSNNAMPTLQTADVWLSQLVLDSRSRLVRQDLTDCHALHRRIMSAFPTSESPAVRQLFGVLYRLEVEARRNRVSLLVQSRVAPDWTRLTSDRHAAGYCLTPPASKPIGDKFAALAEGRRLLFRLRANPTQCTSTGKQSGQRGRVQALFGSEQQLAWLARQGLTKGFQIVSAQVRPDYRSNADRVPHSSVGWQQGRKNRTAPPITLSAVIFEGEMGVTDAGLLRQALLTGVGRGKAYGLGLLSLAPALV